MPIARFQLPDGRVARFEVPEGTTPEQAQSMMEAHFSQPQEQPAQQQTQQSAQPQSWGDVAVSAVSNAPASLGNLIGGVASSIRHPIDTASNLGKLVVGAGESMTGKIAEAINPEWTAPPTEREQMANQVGGFYKDRYGSEEGFKNALATDPAGVAMDLSTVLGGGGAALKAGGLTKAADIANTASRFTNPINLAAKSIAGAGKLAAPAAGKLMQSAIKPTIEQLRTGKAATAIQTMLDEGLNATSGGVDKLKTKVGDLNNEISNSIANSNAVIDKNKVLASLLDTKNTFAKQVSPTNDLNAIESVASDFKNHPSIGNDIPVQLAQQLKQGTYKILGGKYGEAGSAATEAQKALARGLKEQIAAEVPGIAGLNAKESRLIDTLKVVERRALMDANKNPNGLALLASSPATWAAFMADKSALFKSLAARMVNSTSGAMQRADKLSNSQNAANLLYQAQQPKGDK